MKNIKTLKVEHWNRGEFIAREDDLTDDFPTKGAEYIVIKEKDFNKLVKFIEVILEDCSGDLEFVKYKVKKILGE